MNIKTVISFLVIVTVYMYDAHGCPSLPNDCRTECITMDNTGCFVCNCIYLVSDGNKHPAGVLGNGCSVFPDECLSSCVSMDDRGCIVCTCPNIVPTTKPATTTTTRTTMPPTERVHLCFDGGYPHQCN
ncbi:hypothetical protein CHS0354_042365 [Potamilus streckersoni]|uniref:Uncharacterized protein n=1 Tax=Potamilus streckersoni TaxID=2493646 RepID=A0AAE0STV3_9BIVA|nr:hypothetical protein CHS0354_042365 [Potamilus streckersoni]